MNPFWPGGSRLSSSLTNPKLQQNTEDTEQRSVALENRRETSKPAVDLSMLSRSIPISISFAGNHVALLRNMRLFLSQVHPLLFTDERGEMQRRS
jgi:hypothetical protein